MEYILKDLKCDECGTDIIVIFHYDKYYNKEYVSHGVCTSCIKNIPLFSSGEKKEFIKDNCVLTDKY